MPDKLYGMAVVAVPKKEDQNTYTLICTPISASNEAQEHIDIVDDLRPDDLKSGTFRLNDFESISKVFVRLVNTLEEIIKRQNDSQAADEPSKPVSLFIGQDGSSPVALDAIYTLLFNQRFHAPMTEEGIHDYVMDRLRIEHNIVPRDAAHMKKIKANEGYKALVETVKTNEAKAHASVTAAETIRTNYLNNAPLSDELRIALRKFPGLLEQSKLKIGHYVNKGKDTASTQTTEDRVLLDFREEAKGNAYYHEELKRRAKMKGQEFGRLINEYPDFFQLEAPSGFRDNTDMQKKLARFDFYYWHPDYRNAFYEGFRETCNDKEKYVKLPKDKKDPPFTNLAFNMIRKVFVGKDNEAEPEPHIRQKMIADAKALSAQLEAMHSGIASTEKKFAAGSLKSEGLRGEKGDFRPDQ